MPTVKTNDIWTGSKRVNVQSEVPIYPIQIGLQAVCVRTLLILSLQWIQRTMV